MEENKTQQPAQDVSAAENYTPPVPPSVPVSRGFITGKWEIGFGALILLLGIALCNFVLYGGFQLGFAIAAAALIVCSAGYLKLSGHRFDWYSGALLGFSVLIAGGFGRSADGFVKYVMMHFLLVAVNLGLCLMAGQNRRSPKGAASLLDAPRALFKLGFGQMGSACRGLGHAVKNSGTAGRRFSSVAVGLLISVPIVAVLISLLMDADAAFEGLLNLLPETDYTEYLYSALWGAGLGILLYSRGVSLHRMPKTAASRPDPGKGINSLTMGTVLAAVCLVYCVYLLSQLAYLSGGFAGILPEEFTMAEYARRGFFEMAWLCAINLSIICGSVWLVKKQAGVPLFLRLCCLFLGIVTIFLVATASAKMFMYIGSYGLTRLRVLTEVIMLWLGLSTVVICAWLFLPGLPYMKLVMLTAMVIGTLVLWADVDTQVAKYNVEAYQSGRLETVDVDYLSSLNIGAVPYIYELTEEEDPEVVQQAHNVLRRISERTNQRDWRSWNWAYASAREILEGYRTGKWEVSHAEPG